jgi:hypothetical protein
VGFASGLAQVGVLLKIGFKHPINVCSERCQHADRLPAWVRGLFRALLFTHRCSSITFLCSIATLTEKSESFDKGLGRFLYLSSVLRQSSPFAGQERITIGPGSHAKTRQDERSSILGISALLLMMLDRSSCQIFINFHEEIYKNTPHNMM